MGVLIIEGIVPDSFENQKEFYLQICEEYQDKAKTFFESTNTTLRSNSIAVRKKEYINMCKAGDRVRYTLEHDHRSDGIRVKAIGCKVL